MGMEYPNSKFNPVGKISLHKGLNRLPCYKEWNYTSIVGIMLYLEGSTMLNMAYDVHPCSRFSHDHQCSHDVGIKHIARYLKYIRTKRLSMKPDSNNLKLDLFTDVDFQDCLLLKKPDIQSVSRVELDFYSILEEFQFSVVQSYSLRYPCLLWRPRAPGNERIGVCSEFSVRTRKSNGIQSQVCIPSI